MECGRLTRKGCGRFPVIVFVPCLLHCFSCFLFYFLLFWNKTAFIAWNTWNAGSPRLLLPSRASRVFLLRTFVIWYSTCHPRRLEFFKESNFKFLNAAVFLDPLENSYPYLKNSFQVGMACVFRFGSNPMRTFHNTIWILFPRKKQKISQQLV